MSSLATMNHPCQSSFGWLQKFIVLGFLCLPLASIFAKLTDETSDSNLNLKVKFGLQLKATNHEVAQQQETTVASLDFRAFNDLNNMKTIAYQKDPNKDLTQSKQDSDQDRIVRRLAETHFFQQIGSDIDGEAAGDESGFSVSLSSDGTVVAIGARWNDGNGIDSGHVRVYQLIGTTSIQLGQDINGEAAGDNSGFSVSLSSDGTIVAIGARYNDGNGIDSGHVRVHQLNGSIWTQIGQDIDGEAAGDEGGFSVSLSSDGTIVAIGARYNDGNGNWSGHVRVYQFNGNTWTQMGDDIDGEAAGDLSGFSVSLSSEGTTVAIGAKHNDGNGDKSGHVRVYQFNGIIWTQMGDDIDGEASGDQSGYSVSLSSNGTTVAIGAPFNDENGTDSGHVRVYQLSNSNAWIQLGQDINGEAAGDQSGRSVSLSSDGTVVAIGANDYETGTDVGYVRLYHFDGSIWTQLGGDIDGEADGDNSGFSVSLSLDGSTVAIGAYLNDGNGTTSGHVRVYQLMSYPTSNPTTVPSGSPTTGPSGSPSSLPSAAPTAPTISPTHSPTPTPTAAPTFPSAWVPLNGSHTSRDSPLSFVTNNYAEKFAVGFTRNHANGTINTNDWDAFMWKWKVDGDSIIRHWKLHLGGPGHDIAYSVATDVEGNVYVCGKTSQSLAGFMNAGGTDVFVSKVNRDGMELWHNQFGTTGDDAATKIRLRADKISVAVGGTMSGQEFLSWFSVEGEYLNVNI